MTFPATLAILSGGKSERLGSDKGLFQPLGDEPLVARAIRLLGRTFREILVVVRDRVQAAQYAEALTQHLHQADHAAIRIVTDECDGGDNFVLDQPRAAISGVLSALRAAKPGSMVALVAVDQVGVRHLHLQKLLGLATGGQAAAFAESLNAPLPFPAVWPESASRRLAAIIKSGELSVRKALEQIGSRSLELGEFRDELSINGNSVSDLNGYFGRPLFDPFGRRLHYLRFSLTEACNLSCTYCLPDGFPEWYRHKARLGMPQIETLLRGFRQLGFRKVRFTGGEPTVHPRCLEALGLARRVGFEQIALTTNGLLMPDLAPWLDAGLTDLNVSLDSLDEETFFKVTKNRGVNKVRHLVEQSSKHGISVKVNTVLMRTINGQRRHIEDLIDWGLGLNITLRFIELMETRLNGAFSGRERVLGSEIEPLLAERGLIPEPNYGRGPDLRGPAMNYSSARFLGRIGLINPMSCNFCSKCNRLRVTAKGRMKLCLFGDDDLPLDLSSPAAVALNVRRLIDRKPERHYLEEGLVGNVATFRTIGG